MRFTLVLLALTAAAAPLFADDAADVRAARSVFEQNLAAIRNRDAEGYRAVYWKNDKLARTGATGFVTGYDDFAKNIGAGWPDTFEATDIRLTPVRPGVVYGSYRYRVRYGTVEQSGISERLFLDTPDGWKIALTGAVQTPGVPPSPRALVGATLVDGKGGAPVAKANVIVREGKIECAGTAADCPVPAGVDVVDAQGLWITPGLIDAHVHFSQTGWADGRPDALDLRATHPYEQVVASLESEPERFARSYLCSGVTGVFDVGGYPWTLRLAERFADDTMAPHVTAAGPLLSTRDHWLNVPAMRQFIHLKSEETGREGVRYLKAAGAKAVKVWFIVSKDLPLAGSEPWVQAAADEAKKAGLPLIVHATGLAEAKAALRAGAKLLVHSVWEPIDDELIALAKQNGTILTPTLTVMRGYTRLASGATTVDDPNGCVDKATLAKIASTPAGKPASDRRTAELERVAAANLKRLVAEGVPIATGTDAGNPLTLHGVSIYAELEAMQAAGMTPMQVIVASTSTAARAAMLDAETGTVEKGKAADLVLLGADPTKDVSAFRRVKHVMRAGVLRSIEELHVIAIGD